MGRPVHLFFKGLQFRLIAPVVIIMLLLGAGLYVFVLDAVSEFAERQIRAALADLTRQVYDICDRNFTALMQEGLVEDPRAVRVRKVKTLEAIEDLMQRRDLQGLLFDTATGALLIDNAPAALIAHLKNRPSLPREIARLNFNGGYYLQHETFQPWRWSFILVRDAGSYARLILRVRRTYVLTVVLLSLVVVSLLIALNLAVRRPLRQIIAALRQGKAPNYRGTAEFEFLGDSIRAMMATLEENTEWLSRLYQMAVSHRGEGFLERVAETVAAGFGGNAVITRFDSEANRWHVSAMHLDGRDSGPRPDDLCSAVCERIVREGQPLIVSQGAAQLFPTAVHLKTAGAEACIGYPIFDREARAIGVLQAFGPGRTFSPWDRNLFQTICQMIAGEFEIAARRKAESELREHVFRTQKLESLGVLAGGIAHDFNNLLTAIIGNISLAKLDAHPDHAGTKRLAAAEKAAVRAQDLTRQLLTFAKGGAPVKESVTRLDELIQETVDFSRRGSSVAYELDFAPDLWPVQIDAGQFGQVIQNLVVNAQQAMAEGGRIRIKTENRVIDHRTPLPLAPGRYVHISVSDSGFGIAEADLKKIFDPYFTTKTRGSGLGLAVCFSIIKQHDGHIAVQSQIGCGTVFEIYLPATQKAVPKVPSNSGRRHRGHGRILVMDDEDVIREWLGDALQQMGYTPEFAENGEQAVAAHATALKRGQPFAALIMDLTIPGGMGGKQALEQIRQKEPAVVAVVSSGYCNDPVMADFSRFGFSAALPKPFGMALLAETLDGLLGRDAPEQARCGPQGEPCRPAPESA